MPVTNTPLPSSQTHQAFPLNLFVSNEAVICNFDFEGLYKNKHSCSWKCAGS